MKSSSYRCTHQMKRRKRTQDCSRGMCNKLWLSKRFLSLLEKNICLKLLFSIQTQVPWCSGLRLQLRRLSSDELCQIHEDTKLCSCCRHTETPEETRVRSFSLSSYRTIFIISVTLSSQIGPGQHRSDPR